MRKSVSPLPGNEGGVSAGGGRRVFGVPLQEVSRTSTAGGLEVPELVKQLVDYIEEHGRVDPEGLFLVNGNAERVDWLRRRYDSGEEVELQKEADLASAVSLLRLFLQLLPQALVPPEALAPPQGHTLILQLHQDPSSEEDLVTPLRFLLHQLPPLHVSLLRFLLRFLSSVSSLQTDRWDANALAAVFGPDIFHLSTEDLRDQNWVSRVLVELLENQDVLFDSEDEDEDDVSSTNDCSSLNEEQITELLDDERCEAEELPQDDGPSASDSVQHPEDSNTHSSHLSPISILPSDSAEIIQRTIRAAVEQHLYELKTSISGYEQGLSPSEPADQGCHGDGDQQTVERSPCETEGETPRTLANPTQGSHEHTQDCESSQQGVGMDPRMDVDQEDPRDSENNFNWDQPTVSITSDSSSCCCDQNANTDQLMPSQSSSGPASQSSCSPASQSYSGHAPPLHLFPDHQWDAASPPSHLHLPPIDFSCMHLQKEGQDPVPAFKSWQDDSDGGEAQLSPLAGRMLPLPLLPLEEEGGGEEGEGGRDDSPSSSRAHHHLLARRFLDFGAHGAQRFLQQDLDATSPSKAPRPRRASCGSREALRGDAANQHLSRKLQHLKKKIRQFEEQFEKERNYKPSHGDKAANPKVLKWMTDLTKLRRQIKDARHRAEVELGPLTRPRSNTLPRSFGSTLEQSVGRDPEVKGQRPSREETLDLIQRRVRGRRTEDGRPDDIKKMTKEQLSSEKTVLQKNLLHYEGLHGRPVSREERLVVKPLYDRYRLVKQMLTRVSITPITVSPSSKRRSQTLQPIIEGETAHFWEEIKEEEEEEQRGGGGQEEEREEEREEEEEEDEEEEEEEGESSGGEMQSPEVIMAVDLLTPTQGRGSTQEDRRGDNRPIRDKEGTGRLALDLRLSSSHASSMPELLGQLWKARAEKKKLRKTIREFEEDFYQHNGRTVQKEDRVSLVEEYRAYKRIKAKLRLLEVLISKQDSSKSI